jgi:hypothetical protein
VTTSENNSEECAEDLGKLDICRTAQKTVYYDVRRIEEETQ